MPAPKSIFLDLDDTIINFESIQRSCWKQVAEEFSGSLGIQPEDFVSAILRQSGWFWSDPDRHREWRQNLEAARFEIVSAAMKKLGIYEGKTCRDIVDSFTVLRNESIEPVQGAIETLETIREKGIATTLITNGSSASQREKVERFGLGKYFDFILIEGEQGFGKPDERIYIMALDLTGILAEDTWMVGDNITWDVLAPQKLGIKGFWIDYKNRGTESTNEEKPYRTLRSLPDLLQYLK